MRTILVILMCVNFSVNAQLTKACYDRNDNPAGESESDYCTIGRAFPKLKTPGGKDSVWVYIDTVRAYYTGINKLKFIKIYNANGLANGNYIEYHRNGKVKHRGTLLNGVFTSYYAAHYPNGKLNYTLQFLTPEEKPSTWNHKILNYYDSVGTALVKSGNGMCNGVLLQPGVREVGKVKNGLRDSIWSEYQGDTLIRLENYVDGRFVEGVAYYMGSGYKYYKFEEEPSYPGGYEALMEVIRKNMRMPVSARRGIAGTVITSFVVSESGALTDINVFKGFDKDCDKEALRVVSTFEKWNPGRQRGRPVKVRFNLPIRFISN